VEYLGETKANALDSGLYSISRLCFKNEPWKDLIHM